MNLSDVVLQYIMGEIDYIELEDWAILNGYTKDELDEEIEALQDLIWLDDFKIEK